MESNLTTYQYYFHIIKFNYRFIDSLQHLNTSLDKLTQNLTHGGLTALNNLWDYVENEHGGSDVKFNLLTRKGVYPYSYITNVTKFEEGEIALQQYCNLNI